MSNDAEVRARTLIASHIEQSGFPIIAEGVRNGRNATIMTDEVVAILLAAEARPHDGEWEAMREALKPFAECADWAGDGFADDDTVGAMSYCGLTIGNLRAARSALSAVPLFDDGPKLTQGDP